MLDPSGRYNGYNAAAPREAVSYHPGGFSRSSLHHPPDITNGVHHKQPHAQLGRGWARTRQHVENPRRVHPSRLSGSTPKPRLQLEFRCAPLELRRTALDPSAARRAYFDEPPAVGRVLALEPATHLEP